MSSKKTRFAEYSKNVEEGKGEEESALKKPLSEMTFIYDMFKTSIGNIIEKNEGDNLGKL